MGEVALNDRINELEREMLKHPQVPCPVIHRFAPGIYIREVTLPADSLCVGHHQNFEQQNVMLKGRVTVLNEDGSTSELRAPLMFVGKPGRKIGYVHEEVTWLNIYATEERDIEKLEAHFLTKSEGWHQGTLALDRQVNLLSASVSHKDFHAMLEEFGRTPEEVRKQAERTDDMTDLPNGAFKIKVADSLIEGKGLFATADIEPGELIAPARLGEKRTIAGRYTNHSPMPNAAMARGFGNDIILIATTRITGCAGGQNGDEITIDYREAVKLNREIQGEV